MLKMDQGQEPAQVQVSSQEFVEAVTSIETRRQEALKQDSLPVGEAIRQLGLDLTPEEVWAEVQARRFEQTEAVGFANRQKTRKKMSRGRLFLIASLALNLALLISLINVSNSHTYWQNIQTARTAPAATGFNGLLQSLNTNSFDAGKLSFVKFIAPSHAFTSHQAQQILQSFSFDTDRVEAAVVLHNRVTDKENFYHVLDTFSFDQGRQDLLARIGGMPAPK